MKTYKKINHFFLFTGIFTQSWCLHILISAYMYRFTIHWEWAVAMETIVITSSLIWTRTTVRAAVIENWSASPDQSGSRALLSVYRIPRMHSGVWRWTGCVRWCWRWLAMPYNGSTLPVPWFNDKRNHPTFFRLDWSPFSEEISRFFDRAAVSPTPELPASIVHHHLVLLPERDEHDITAASKT